MAGSFFSDGWYRVDGLKPALLPQVRLHRHRYRGDVWYVLEDRLSGRSHRFTPAAYRIVGRMDGRRTIGEIWRTVSTELGEDAPTQDDVITLLAQLHASDLLRSEMTPDTDELLKRQTKQSRMLLWQNLLSPVSFRVPLFDPDRFLGATVGLIRPLVGWLGVVLWLALVVPAVMVAGAHWQELTGNLFDRVLSVDNLLILALCYPVIKALHELGHGYVTKAFGGEVHEIGVMFLVFFPVPYVDATSAAAFRSRWRRAAVGVAGIVVETAIAAAAIYAWTALQPGFARAIAFNVILIAGVSTVLVNGNPLLRFDGYYVLADLLAAPNLGPRANRYVGYLTDRYVFGADGMRPFAATWGERVIFLVYAPLSFLYRLLVMAGIALFIVGKFFVVGILLAAWSLLLTLVVPAAKGIWHVATSPLLRRTRRRAVAITVAAVGGALAALLLIPAPMSTEAEGVVWLPQDAYVRAGTDGFVSAIDAARNSDVAAGAPLFELEEPAFAAKLTMLRWHTREIELKLQQYVAADPVLAEVTRLELDQARAQYDREVERTARMTVASPRAGRFVPARPLADVVGRHVDEGELLGYVLPDKPETVRVVVTQANIDLLRRRLTRVTLKPREDLGAAYPSSVIREVPAAGFALPSPALGRFGGGTVATDPRDPHGVTALARVFQFDLDLPEEMEDADFGSRVLVRFDHTMEPVGLQIYRRVRQLLLARFNA